MSPTEIRDARSDDAERIAALLGELGYPTLPEEVGPRLNALQSDHDAVRVAVRDDRVVGLIGLHRLAGLHGSLPMCYITALVTDASLHGQGIGKLLLAHAEQWARERGCDRITVTSANHRTGAHAFYEGHGFPQTGLRFVKPLGKVD